MKNVIMLLLMLMAGSIYAQENQNTYYFKKNGKQVQNKDSADYIRTISVIDSSGKTYKKLTEYYKNGVVKTVGRTSSINGVSFSGDVNTFYNNGNVESKRSLSNNMLIGDAFEFFRNGELKAHKYYEKHTSLTDKAETSYKLLQAGDSTGRKFLDGKGNGIVDHINGQLKEKGAYKDGLREGSWEIEDLKLNVSLVETFQKGIFKSGIYKLENGQTGKYDTYFKLAEPKEGMENFIRFIQSNLRYSEEIKNSSLNSRVIINFTIETDGTLSNFKAIKSESTILTDEAIRVLKLSSKWSPALNKGRPVKSSYTIPILFNKM